MTTRHNPRGEVAQLYHPDIRDALIQAAARRDYHAIDRVTDQLVDQGLARPRSDGSRFESVSGNHNHNHNPKPGGDISNMIESGQAAREEGAE